MPQLLYNKLLGLYEVDVGLRQPSAGLSGLNIMAYEDMNGDKYTDIITVNDAKTEFTMHLFEPAKKMFLFQKTVKPIGCSKIVNIVVGRSVDRVRIFVTCQ